MILKKLLDAAQNVQAHQREREIEVEDRHYPGQLLANIAKEFYCRLSVGHRELDKPGHGRSKTHL